MVSSYWEDRRARREEEKLKKEMEKRDEESLKKHLESTKRIQKKLRK